MEKMLSNLNLFILPFWLTILCSEVKAYTQISAYGDAPKDEGPRIFKAINADLIYPETFNSSNNVISTTQIPLTSITSSTFPAHYTQDSVNDTAIPVTPAIYVTPSSQISFTPQVRNDQAMESNQMQAKTQSDYPKQPLEEETYENLQTNNNHQQEQYTSTGRAIDQRPAYQLDQFMNAAKPYKAPARPHVLTPSANYYPVRPHTSEASQYTYNNNNAKVLPYPQSLYRHYQRPQLQVLRRPSNQAEVYKLGGRGQISDRFTPGEAVASALFTKNSQKHNHNRGNKIAQPSNLIQSYAPQKDLYAFPPNINAKYPKPSEDAKAALASISANSYAPPPAGPIKSQVNFPLLTSASSNDGYKYNVPVNSPSTNSNEGYKYNGPVNPAYLPSNDGKDEKPIDDGSNDADAMNGDDSIGVLPASAMDNGENDNKAQNGDEDNHAHSHDHDHPPTGYDTGKEYPTPPPGWVEEHPEDDHGPSFPYSSHHFPNIIYDDHHHDFHHNYHHHHVEPPMTTLPPPEPLPSEQPQEPRVKKYSYFYIGRKLWYIPLYFTVWFSFYVLWLILKSIARHKVNLPNHYVSKRSISNYTDDEAKDYINHLTISVLQQIENFRDKYKT